MLSPRPSMTLGTTLSAPTTRYSANLQVAAATLDTVLRGYVQVPHCRREASVLSFR
jgi:hypothetical protein